MIRLIRPEEGVPVRDVDVSAIDAGPLEDGWVWIDVEDGTEAEIRRIGQIFGFDEVALSEVVGSTVFPKVSDLAHHLFLITHSPGLSAGRVATHEVDVFVAPSTLVTIHREPVSGVEATIDQVARAERGTTSPGTAVASMLETGADRSLELIEALDDEISELEELAFTGQPDVLARIQDLRRDAIILRRAMAPQRDMLRELSRAEHLFDEPARRQLESAHYDYLRIVESLDGARALLAAVLETYRSAIAERTNEIMKVLTVFAVVLLPLSLLAGIYGMNFSNMPLLDTSWGFYAVLVVMGVAGFGLWLYFAGRGFVRVPRVPRVDLAVGRGLAGIIDLTTQPVRAVGKRRGDSEA